jgi:hypothetical protein
MFSCPYGPKRRICLAMLLALCFGSTTFLSVRAQTPEGNWTAELRESEHKTIRHPTRKFYASIWPDGVQVSFKNGAESFPTYTFPAENLFSERRSICCRQRCRICCPCA